MSTIDCPAKEVFVRALMGELSELEKKDFSNHVDRCPKCGLQFAALSRVQNELDARKEAVPDMSLSEEEDTDFREWAKGQAEALERRGERAFWPRVRLGAALAGSVVLVLLGYYFLGRGPGSQQDVRGGAIPELRLLKPGENLKEAPVLFTWSQTTGVDIYDFTLVDNALNTLSSVRSREPQFRLPEEVRLKLTRGIPYLWTVKALDDYSRVICSATRHFEIE